MTTPISSHMPHHQVGHTLLLTPSNMIMHIHIRALNMYIFIPTIVMVNKWTGMVPLVNCDAMAVKSPSQKHHFVWIPPWPDNHVPQLSIPYLIVNVDKRMGRSKSQFLICPVQKFEPENWDFNSNFWI